MDLSFPGSCRSPARIVLVGLLASSILGSASNAFAQGIFRSRRQAPAAPPQLTVTSDFSGGSGEARIDQPNRRIVLNPTTHPGKGWACWWYVQVSGLVPGEILTLDVGEAPWATPDQAAVSSDNRHWEQTTRGTRVGKRIIYQHRVTHPVQWFAWGPPYTVEAAAEFVQRTAERPGVEAFQLAESREGRPVWALRIEPPDVEPNEAVPPLVWVQARQHAWEAGSSWVGQGFTQWLFSEDPRAIDVRRRATFIVVPVMDVDSVAIGAGGKRQDPHDHNRDWTQAPHWPAVHAAMTRLAEAGEAGRLAIFLDLHNPSAGSENPFFYITPRHLLSAEANQKLDRFLTLVKEEMTEPLAYLGETHESGPQYDDNWQAISKNWVSSHCDPDISVTLETAWNTPHGTTTGYQAVGRQLAAAVARFLAE